VSSIRNIENRLSALAQEQREAVDGFAPVLQKAQADRSAAEGALRRAAETMVVTSDDDRYAALTRAAKAGGSTQDFTALVKQRTQEDAANRAERSDLEKKWGSKEQVEAKAGELKQEINLIDSARAEIMPEIAAFDATTQKIQKHNTKFPKAPISEETNASYKKFRTGRFLLWLTFINRGPHDAYRVVHEFTKTHGDYYEKSRGIAKVRQNEGKLETDEAAKQTSFNEEMTVDRRMIQLDNSYRGPEGIAREVRGLVHDLLLQSPAFAQGLIDELKSEPAREAAVASAKERALGTLYSTLQAQQSQAQSMLTQLQDPIEYLQGVLDKVGGDDVYFDISGLERNLAHVQRISRAAARDGEEALSTLGSYAPAAGDGAAAIDKAVKNLAVVPAGDARLSLDFTSLKSSVSEAVDAYEREQRRLAELARLAAIAAQEAAAREEAARQRSSTFNEQSRRDDIGEQSAPVEPRQTEFRENREDIGRGSQGIEEREPPRNDKISDGNDGIEP
jgi:hypothetical protein